VLEDVDHGWFPLVVGWSAGAQNAEQGLYKSILR
jgi:hypothetical protein